MLRSVKGRFPNLLQVNHFQQSLSLLAAQGSRRLLLKGNLPEFRLDDLLTEGYSMPDPLNHNCAMGSLSLMYGRLPWRAS